MRGLLAQARTEVSMTLRRGDALLLALGIPVLLLVFFSLVNVLPTGFAHPVDFLAPGILALAATSTALVSLSIATGFERGYGVLKRLGSTPLGRPSLIMAKLASVVALEAVQVAVIVPVALGLGWRPSGGVTVAAALVAFLLGTAGFAGIGLLMAGTLRAEVNLAAANGLYVVLLLLGGMVVPLTKLPGALEGLARALPAAALTEALSRSLGTGQPVPGRSWLVLVIWAVAAPVAASLMFRWE